MEEIIPAVCIPQSMELATRPELQDNNPSALGWGVKKYVRPISCHFHWDPLCMLITVFPV